MVTPPKGVLSVPWGWMVLPLFYEQKTTTQWGHAWVLSKLSAKEAKKCSADVLATIKAYNEGHFATIGGNAMWKARAKSFSDFMGRALA